MVLPFRSWYLLLYTWLALLAKMDGRGVKKRRFWRRFGIVTDYFAICSESSAVLG